MRDVPGLRQPCQRRRLVTEWRIGGGEGRRAYNDVHSRHAEFDDGCYTVRGDGE